MELAERDAEAAGQEDAAMVVAEVGGAYVEDTPRPAGDVDGAAGSGAAAAAAAPAVPGKAPARTAAWLAAVAASGGPPPGPAPAGEPGVPPPPPPCKAPPPQPSPGEALQGVAAEPPLATPAGEPKASAAGTRSVPPNTPTYASEGWEGRLAAARAHGGAAAAALATARVNASWMER